MIREIVTKSPEKVMFSSHAQEELANDGYSIMDGWNVLKATASRVTRAEPERGRWRYHLATKQLALVIEFWSDGKGLVVVTGWATKGVVR